MVERNEKGKIARKYFIDCEKELKSIKFNIPDFTNPAIAARAWAEQYKQKLLLENKVKEDAPKVEFAESVHESDDLITISDLAKLLGTGEKRLFKRLRSDKYLGYSGGNYNKPNQKYMDSKQPYFKLKEMVVDKGNKQSLYQQSLITGKGQLYFQKKYNGVKI